MSARTIPMTFQSGLVCAMVYYAVHVAAFGLAQMDFDRTLAIWLGWQGRALSIAVNSGSPILQGLLFGEIACLSVWLNISDGKASARLLVYGAFVMQVLMFMVFWHTGMSFSNGIEAMFFGLGLAMAMPLFTLLPLRMCRQRVRLNVSTGANRLNGSVRPTIAHAIYAIFVIALLLGVPKMVADYDDWMILGAMCVVWSCVIGVITFAGLSIATGIRYPILRVGLILLISGFLSVIYGLSERLIEVCAGAFALLLFPSLLPLFGVWLVGKFGYSIQSPIQTSVTESHPHPLMELDERSDND